MILLNLTKLWTDNITKSRCSKFENSYTLNRSKAGIYESFIFKRLLNMVSVLKYSTSGVHPKFYNASHILISTMLSLLNHLFLKKTIMPTYKRRFQASPQLPADKTAEPEFKPRVFTSITRVHYPQNAISWNSRDSHKIPYFAPMFLKLQVLSILLQYCFLHKLFPEVTHVTCLKFTLLCLTSRSLPRFSSPNLLNSMLLVSWLISGARWPGFHSWLYPF